MTLDEEAAASLGIPSEALDRLRRRDGQTFGEVLADAGLAEGAAFTRALADAAGLPYAPTPPVLPVRELLARLPMPYARRHLVLPLVREDDGLAVAVADPADLAPLDDLRFLYQARLRPLVVPAPALREAITRAYDAAASSASDAMEAMTGDGVVLELAAGADPLHVPSDGSLDLLEAGDEAPVIRLVNALLFEAVKAGASDIHLEPFEQSTAVRFRIDGILHDVLAPPARVHATLAARVKIMAGLDIAERRLPQDGRIRLRVAGRDIDVRVSLVPTGFGERVVLRLLDRAATLLDLPELGLTPSIAAALDRLLAQSHGIVLVTGPTGSGKTTTLYAALRRLRTGERNIMTIEDPVEYQLRGVGQIQVNPRIDLTFASGLRAVLRQDPDVILVGEIRDRETVEIALQSALTGHLVFSTLHTNDAAGALTRLLDMAVEPFLISSSLLAVLAQRLVRRVCATCGQDGPPSAEERAAFADAAPAVLRHAGSGCEDCRGTGYRGRTAIHELLVVDDPIRALVMARADASAIRRHAIAHGMATLRDDGLAKAHAGVTTLAEVLRATQDEG
ncbi:MAG TPA: type II secretion system ATPase GspE [Candidatus Nitrosopolaris sp.]|nr:type II secretion system ATPase GspE [Candidatus Nitrosopolaris sp.]